MDSGRWEGDALCRQALPERLRDMLCAWELTDRVGLLSDLKKHSAANIHTQVRHVASSPHSSFSLTRSR